MWFASIWIFTFNYLGNWVQIFMENLLDEIQHQITSWSYCRLQTKGKHYLARKDNISKFSNIDIISKIFINENALCKIENKEYKIKEINFPNQII